MYVNVLLYINHILLQSGPVMGKDVSNCKSLSASCGGSQNGSCMCSHSRLYGYSSCRSWGKVRLVSGGFPKADHVVQQAEHLLQQVDHVAGHTLDHVISNTVDHVVGKTVDHVYEGSLVVVV